MFYKEPTGQEKSSKKPILSTISVLYQVIAYTSLDEFYAIIEEG